MKEHMENVVQLRAMNGPIDDPLHELMTEFDHVEEEYGVKVDVQKREREKKVAVKSLSEALDRIKFYMDEIESALP